MEEDRITKSFRAVIKAIDKENYTVDALVSTGDVDRHNEIIEPTAFKKRIGRYKAHPILLSSHGFFGQGLQSQIGEAMKVKVTDEGLDVRFKYYADEGNSEADWAFKLAGKGIAAYSVGFIAKEWKDLEPDEKNSVRRVFVDVELVEISQVLVPSNPNALQRTVDRAEGVEKELAELVLKDLEAMTTKPAPDVTENYIRIRVKDPGLFKDDSLRTVWISKPKGIKSVMGKLKKPKEGQEGKMVVQSYLFDKKKWTVAEAEKWVEEHKDKRWLLFDEVVDSDLFEEEIKALMVKGLEGWIIDEIKSDKNYIDMLLGYSGDSQGVEPTEVDVDVDKVKEVIMKSIASLAKKA